MLELIQFPWSPFCCVQRRILEFSETPFKITDIPPADRSLVWRLTRQRYYQVPILRDGRTVVFETDAHSQVIAKYLESVLQLGLFPPEWDGLQRLVWIYIENEIEECAFKLNDIWYEEFVPARERLDYLRWKERRFGRGCVAEWCRDRGRLGAELERRLLPFEQMLARRPWLLDGRPRFVDFDLWGMLANYLYSGHYRLPRNVPNVAAWYRRLSRLTFSSL